MRFVSGVSEIGCDWSDCFLTFNMFYKQCLKFCQFEGTIKSVLCSVQVGFVCVTLQSGLMKMSHTHMDQV
jgi:hypothetical protein